MWYVQPNKAPEGYYYPAQSTKAPGLVELPDEFLDKFIEYNGFVKLTIKDNVVTAIRANTTALEAFKAKLAEQAEQESTDTTGDNDVVTWAELDKAYNEGRDAAYVE